MLLPLSEETIPNDRFDDLGAGDLPSSKRRPELLHEDRHYHVNCFATNAGAEAFMQEFGGEWFDPRERGKGLNWNQWYRGKSLTR